MNGTKYIVYENTLEEISKLAEDPNSAYYSSVTLYKYKIDRSNLSEEQKAIQQNNHWYTESRHNVRFTEESLYNLIDKLAFEKVLGGSTGDIVDELYNEIMDTKVRSTVEVKEYEEDGETQYRTIVEEEIATKEDGNYTKDLTELEKVLEKTTNKAYSKKEKYYLEEYEVYAYHYEVQKLPETIKKLIKRFVKNNLAYCLLKNRVIVPQEYLDKGRDGITEWKELKASKNKNNSMEKKMLQEIYKKQKTFAYNAIEQIMWGAVKDGMNWSVPCLEIEGRFNRTKSSKLANQLLADKSKQEIMQMSNEDFVKIFKDYWRNKLQDAIKAIDKFEVEDRKN